MNWENVCALILGNLALILPIFLWNRSEANSDRRQASVERSEDRKQMIGLLKGIQDEMKDFHGRLCALEEKYHGLRK